MAAFAVSVYMVFLTTAEFGHHDLACHLKTPLHCTACASSPLSSNPATPLVTDASRFADAGRAIAIEVLTESALLATHASGRSPPAAA